MKIYIEQHRTVFEGLCPAHDYDGHRHLYKVYQKCLVSKVCSIIHHTMKQEWLYMIDKSHRLRSMPIRVFAPNRSIR